MKKIILLGLLVAIISCKKNDNSSSNDGFSLGSVFEGKRVLEKELTKEGGLFYYDGKPFTGIGYKMYDEKRLQFETSYVEGKEEGVQKYWSRNGQLVEEFQKKGERKDGMFTSWYENGQIKKEMTFKAGDVVGEVKRWHENGQQWSVANYIEPDPQTSADLAEGFIHESKQVGIYKEWFENGQLYLECNYNNDGQLEGLLTKWFENGKIYEKTNFKKNKEIGVIQRWYDSGQIAYEKNTANEFVKEWWQNGILKAETIDIGKTIIRKNYSERGIQDARVDTISGYNSI